MTRRTYVTSRDDRDEAWLVAGDYRALLVAQGLTPSHRIGVEPRGHAFWVVLIVDDEDEENES